MRYVNFPLPTNIEIVNDEILFTSWSETPVAFLIRSKDIAKDLKKYFEIVWKEAKP